MVNLTDFIGKNPTPSARLSSAIISLMIVTAIMLKIMPSEYVSYSLAFLVFHLINHLYVGISEIKIPVCHKCGASLKPKPAYEKHICKAPR